MELLVFPFNRRLHVQPGANLLEQLRAHDVPVSYSCTDGRCGLCRCQVLVGDVLDCGHELDNPSTQLDDTRHVLACQTILTESCTIRILEPEEVVVHPAQAFRATVSGLEKVGREVIRLRLLPPRRFDFSPGQYATLQFAPGLVRPYSMASVNSDRELEFHVAVVDGGHVTPYIADRLRLGDIVRVSGPLGTSFLRRNKCDPMLCVAAGTGLAPVLSIVRGAAATWNATPIHVYYGAQSETELYGADLLRSVASQYANVHVSVAAGTSTRSTDIQHGLIIDRIAATQNDLSDWRGYFFGSPLVVEAATLLVKRLGMRRDRIHGDAFYPSGIQ